MRRLLQIILIISLIPSLLALLPRLRSQHPGPVLLAVSWSSLEPYARQRGLTPLQLLQSYQALGVRGVGVEEPTVAQAAAQGALLYVRGSTLKLLDPRAPVDASWFYASGPLPTYTLPHTSLRAAGRLWEGFPVDISSLPALPDYALIRQLNSLGYQVIYRPLNSRFLAWPPPAIPSGISSVAFAGVNGQVLGYPHHLSEARQLIQVPLDAIYGFAQKGFHRIAKGKPVLSLFGLSGAYLNLLGPAQAALKYALGAHERGYQILYFRPLTAHPGDTRAFLRDLTHDLAQRGVALGQPQPLQFHLSPLRWFAWVGVLAGLALLALSYPQPLGWIVALFLLAVSFAFARSQAGPLLAGLTFPVLGLVSGERGLRLWAVALLYTLAGAVFLSALGSTPAAVLNLEPFRGVGLLLLIPPFLAILSFFPRGKFKRVILGLWEHRPSLGQLFLGALLLVALAIAFLRRGNQSPLPASSLELKIRTFLEEHTIRPRFKDIIGEASILLALFLPWPTRIRNILLVLFVLAQASILDSFATYPTPLVLSLERSLNGLLAGILVGAVLYALIRAVWDFWNRLPD